MLYRFGLERRSGRNGEISEEGPRQEDLATRTKKEERNGLPEPTRPGERLAEGVRSNKNT